MLTKYEYRIHNILFLFVNYRTIHLLNVSKKERIFAFHLKIFVNLIYKTKWRKKYS